MAARWKKQPSTLTNLEFVASHDWHKRGFNYKQVKPQPTKLKSEPQMQQQPKLQQLKPQRQMLQPLTNCRQPWTPHAKPCKLQASYLTFQVTTLRKILGP